MKSFLRIIAGIALSPIWVLLGLLVFGVLFLVSIPVSIQGYLQKRKWIGQLKRMGRFVNSNDLAANCGSGTLIIDQPGWGGKVKNYWWTTDDVISLSPFEISPLEERMASLKSEFRGDGTDLPFDRWVFRTYLNDESGSALLVSVKNNEDGVKELQAKVPELKIVETWSAPHQQQIPTDAN